MIDKLPMTREVWDNLWAGDIIHTSAGSFKVAKIEEYSYPLKEGQTTPDRNVFEVTNEKHESLRFTDPLTSGSYVEKAQNDAMLVFANAFYRAAAHVGDQVEILDVEGGLEHGLEVESLDMPSGHTLDLTITRDRAIPEVVLENWLKGKDNDIHLVTGIEKHEAGWPMGAIIPAHLQRLYQNVYPMFHVRVELAFEAGADHMAYYRVWLRPLSSFDQRVAWVERLTGRVVTVTEADEMDVEKE